MFAGSMHRRVLDGGVLDEVHPQLRALLDSHGIDDPEVLAEIVRTGRVRSVPGVPEQLAALFPTAHEIEPRWHVRMQAAFQRYVDAAVSKTVNLPNGAGPDDVDQVFRLAHELGCKGVTVFREGSRRRQVLNAGVSARRSDAAGVDTSESAAAAGAASMSTADARSGESARRVLPRPVPDGVDGLPSRRFRVPTPSAP